MQKSKSRSGSAIIALAWWSSTVIGSRKRGVRVGARHVACVHRHVRHLLARRAVPVHVPPDGEGEHLPRRLQAVRHRERERAADRGHALADLPERLAVALALLHRRDLVHHHEVGLVGGDGHRRVRERAAHRRAAATPGLRRVAQPLGAERGHELGGLHRAVVRRVAVDVLGADAGVGARRGDRLDREAHESTVGELAAPSERHRADADDRGLVPHVEQRAPSSVGRWCGRRSSELVAGGRRRVGAVRSRQRCSGSWK